MTENEALKTAEICFQVVLEEYRNYSERIEKLNVRVQIAIAACAFLFAVMIETMKNINFFSEVLIVENKIYLSLFSLFCVIVVGIFIYVFFRLLSILNGNNMQRIDLEIFNVYDVLNEDPPDLVKGLTKNYHKFIKNNNGISNRKFEQFDHCLFWIGIYSILLLLMVIINLILKD